MSEQPTTPPQGPPGQIAPGVVRPGYQPAPPRPSEDERWAFMAEQMVAIRKSVGIIAAVLLLSLIAGAAWAIIAAAQASESSGY